MVLLICLCCNIQVKPLEPRRYFAAGFFFEDSVYGHGPIIHPRIPGQYDLITICEGNKRLGLPHAIIMIHKVIEQVRFGSDPIYRMVQRGYFEVGSVMHGRSLLETDKMVRFKLRTDGTEVIEHWSPKDHFRWVIKLLPRVH